MAWHDIAKPNHYQQYLSYSYGPTGKNLGPSPGKPRDASKSMRCWWRLEKGLEERARLTGRDMAPSPKPFLKESPRKRQIQLLAHLLALGKSAALKTPSWSKPSNHFLPLHMSRSKTSLVGSSATFKRVGRKCTDTATPNAKPTAKIFRRRGSRAAADDPAARQLYPLHHMLPV